MNIGVDIRESFTEIILRENLKLLENSEEIVRVFGPVNFHEIIRVFGKCHFQKTEHILPKQRKLRSSPGKLGYLPKQICGNSFLGKTDIPLGPLLHS